MREQHYQEAGKGLLKHIRTYSNAGLLIHPTKKRLVWLTSCFLSFLHPTKKSLGQVSKGRRYPNLCHFYIVSSDPSFGPTSIPHLSKYIHHFYCTSDGLCRSHCHKSACYVLYYGISFTPTVEASSRSCMHIPQSHDAAGDNKRNWYWV